MTRGVAAFDFDGTVTQRDTLVPFLARRGRLRLARAIVWGALKAATSRRDGARNRLKSHVLAALFEGVSASTIEEAGRTYADTIPDLCRAESLERVQWHRAQGHELVLVTASLGAYARPAGKLLGFDHVIAVELEADSNGVLTGRIDGPNVRAAEKERRLRALLGDEPFELWAYGNSSGDEELLAMADHPTWVGRRGG